MPNASDARAFIERWRLSSAFERAADRAEQRRLRSLPDRHGGRLINRRSDRSPTLRRPHGGAPRPDASRFRLGRTFRWVALAA